MIVMMNPKKRKNHQPKIKKNPKNLKNKNKMNKMSKWKLLRKFPLVFKKFKFKMKFLNQARKNVLPALMRSLMINKNLKIIISLIGIFLMLREKPIKNRF